MSHVVGMQKHTSAEVVVIGGGAIGSAIAYHLAKQGKDVAIVERGEFPCETSKRCDGHVATYDSPPGYFSKLCYAGLELFPKIAPDLPYDIHFEPEGLGLLIDDERDMEAAMSNYEGKLKEGAPVTLWDQKELRHHEPNIADRVLACINFTRDSKLDPMRLTFGLMHRAQEYGAKIYPQTSVTGISLQNEKVTAVRTSQGTITTHNVVFACGAWTPELGNMVGLDIPIRPRQGQILVTERVQSLVGKNYAEFGYVAAKGGRKRLSATPEMEAYGVAFVTEPTESGTVLIGSSRRFVGMNSKPDAAVMLTIAQRATHFFPAYRQVRVIRSYAGVRPATPDGKPIISDTRISGLYVASGHEGNGIGLSLITGQLMAEILEGKTPVFDIAPLTLNRFSASDK